MFDPDEVRALLVSRAREGETISYSEALRLLGHPFSRPRMRALCRVLGHIDELARGRGEPELAVLVVRESDRLPGQGWWVAGPAKADGYEGSWEGPAARAYVRALQQRAFDHHGDAAPATSGATARE
jgi:hypothetical protein